MTVETRKQIQRILKISHVSPITIPVHENISSNIMRYRLEIIFACFVRNWAGKAYESISGVANLFAIHGYDYGLRLLITPTTAVPRTVLMDVQ